MTKSAPHPDSRSFHFDAQQHGRRVSGRIRAQTVFGAVRVLRMTGLEGIRIRELTAPVVPQTPASVRG